MNPIKKKVLDPSRVRKIEGGFSWIDRRLLREGWIDRLERDEILLYLFLTLVADKEGLSYYSEARMSGLIKIGVEAIEQARERLVARRMVAYEKPVYQVLALEKEPPRRSGGATTIGEVLRDLMAGKTEEGRRAPE